MIGRGIILVASTVLLPGCLGGCCSAVEPAPNAVRDWATRDLLLGSSEMDVKWFCFTHQMDYGAAGIHRGFGIGRPCNREQTPPAVLIDFNYDDDRRVTSWHVHGTDTAGGMKKVIQRWAGTGSSGRMDMSNAAG